MCDPFKSLTTEQIRIVRNKALENFHSGESFFLFGHRFTPHALYNANTRLIMDGLDRSRKDEGAE